MGAALSKTVLQSADRGPLLAALGGFAGKPASQWLGAGTPGSNGNLPNVWSRVSALPASALIKAVAAAGPNHCLDAWSFIARALASLLAGDQHAARHFAYYVQLRAALSILASLGIGCFNKTNLIVDQAGTIHRLDPGAPVGLGTHDIVWTALKAWADEPKTAKQFLTLLRLQGSTLADCIGAIWPGYSPEAVAGKLIYAWTLDLRRAREDQALRNQSSYSPHAFNQLVAAPKEYLRFVQHIWRMCEPTTGGSFDKLDRHLLRGSLWLNQSIVEPGLNRGDGAIRNRYSNLPAQVQTIATVQFLTGKDEPSDPDVIVRAKSRAAPSSALAMISRGLLLARVATGFTYSNFIDAGLSPNGSDLRPWVDAVAIDRGFWNPASPVTDLGDLWLDVDEALANLSTSTTTPPACRFDWAVQSPNGLSTISEAERIGIWSLCG